MNSTSNDLKIQSQGDKRNKRNSIKEKRVSSHHQFLICPNDIKKTNSLGAHHRYKEINQLGWDSRK
jgi:hypothetical protein